jgi:hypothetical protein
MDWKNGGQEAVKKSSEGLRSSIPNFHCRKMKTSVSDSAEGALSLRFLQGRVAMLPPQLLSVLLVASLLPVKVHISVIRAEWLLFRLSAESSFGPCLQESSIHCEMLIQQVRSRRLQYPLENASATSSFSSKKPGGPFRARHYYPKRFQTSRLFTA